jgi:nucleoside phosphorylase
MPCAVILTALSVEYLAVRAHLTHLQETIHPQGTIYERGQFADDGQSWDVGIVETGAGNPGAALEAERAIAYFNPDVILYVGVAGGIKDVSLGDVVASTKIYAYESGKAEENFKPLPAVGISSYGLEQRARAEARKTDWLTRLSSVPSPTPTVHVAPIAAGEKVVASVESEVFGFLRSNYSDAVAIEMEGFGFLDAVRANQHVSALVIRGISDMIFDESEADISEYRNIASRHASAFAFQILAKLKKASRNIQDVSTEIRTSETEDDNEANDKLRQWLEDNKRQLAESLGKEALKSHPKIKNNFTYYVRGIERYIEKIMKTLKYPKKPSAQGRPWQRDYAKPNAPSNFKEKDIEEWATLYFETMGLFLLKIDNEYVKLTHNGLDKNLAARLKQSIHELSECISKQYIRQI